MEKRSRDEAAQVQVTVTQVDTVQHSSPCSPDPEPSSAYINLKNNEGKMGPELEELESPSAGTGLETPGQQCPPNEGTWETERTTACQGGHISSPTEQVKSTRITADTTFLKQGHKPKSEENKQFDPDGTAEKERRPALERGYNSTFFFCGDLGGSLLCFVLSVFCVCSVFPNY